MSYTYGTFTDLIANYQTAEQAVNDLHVLYGNPICGTPGFGFKAARKAIPQRIAAGVKLAQATFQLRNYVKDTKANYKRRMARLEAVQSVIPTFTLE